MSTGQAKVRYRDGEQRVSTIMRIITALRERGLLRTLQSLVDPVEDALFERRYGVRTAGIVQLAALSIESANRNKGTYYRALRVGHLRRLFRRLPGDSKSCLVDFGSGKGRVLFVAHLAGFRRAVGVDFAADLCEEAGRNLKSFSSFVHERPDIDIIHLDATRYEIQPDQTVFFFYDPFEVDIFSRVLENIESSLRRVPRTAWLLYCSHQIEHTRLIENHQTWDRIFEERWGGTASLAFRWSSAQADLNPDDATTRSGCSRQALEGGQSSNQSVPSSL